MISLTAVVEPTTPPRVRLTVTTTTVAPKPVPLASAVTIYRIGADGIRRKVILELGAQTVGGFYVGYDYHAPINEPCRYVVVFGAAESATIPAVTVVSDVSWLMHPIYPDRSVAVDEVVSFDAQTEDTDAAAHWPFGARYAVTISDGARRAPAGSATFRVNSQVMQQALSVLFSDGGPVLFNLAKQPGWWDESWCWVQPGQLSTVNPGQTIRYPYRHVTVPYQVIDQPAAAQQVLWTCADVRAAFTTSDDAKAAYLTAADMKTDTRAA